MKVKKSDWSIVREASEKGLVASMTMIVERKRTKENNELSKYFRTKMPQYNGIYDEDIAEDIIDILNDYAKANNLSVKLSMPVTYGTEIYLFPVNENIHLKLLVANEYDEQYVEISYFLINEHTTEKDVDELIDFVNTQLVSNR